MEGIQYFLQADDEQLIKQMIYYTPRDRKSIGQPTRIWSQNMQPPYSWNAEKEEDVAHNLPVF